TRRDASEQQAALRDTTERAVTTRFDLDSGPLVRAELLVLTPEDHVLVLTAHHIVCDGFSFGVIVSDLADFYTARVGAGPKPEEPDSFAEYAAEELQHADTAEYQADEAFWLSKFSEDVPTLDL